MFACVRRSNESAAACNSSNFPNRGLTKGQMTGINQLYTVVFVHRHAIRCNAFMAVNYICNGSS